jgi:hypothetical protein
MLIHTGSLGLKEVVLNAASFDEFDFTTSLTNCDSFFKEDS